MRPARLRLQDFAGRTLTLDASPANWHRLNPGHNDGGPVLTLGLGPTGKPPFSGNKIYWLEAPCALEQLLASPDFKLPDQPPYSNVFIKDLPDLASSCQIYFYHPGMRVAPDFWGPVLASLYLASRNVPGPAKTRLAWLPGNRSQLLFQELWQTLPNLGFTPVNPELPIHANANDFLAAFSEGLPDLVLSVNFRGLDNAGNIYHLLRALDIPLAIWLVDNPWHLLSGIPLPWWQKENLFVTDESFIAPLKAYGAENVFFCPLATAPHMWRHKPASPSSGAPLFIGRASFPDKKAFFGGQPPDSELMEEALQGFNSGDFLPDYHWWAKKLGVRLWPGLAGRKPGLGADACSAYNRGRWLKAAPSLVLAGDPAWLELPGNRKVIPGVDYYGALPELYARSSAIINITSLLLPHSLNQRHFDVWAAGTPLLGDNTSGLNIFPRELTAPIILHGPEEIEPRLSWLKSHPADVGDLVSAWQKELARAHTYEHRLEFILSRISMKSTQKKA